MPYYKFEEDDIFHNRIKTHPSCEFFVHSGTIYYNNKHILSGVFNNAVTHVSSGHVSLYELNVDRDQSKHTYDSLLNPGGVKSLIFPFVTKDGSLSTFKTITIKEFNEDFLYGDEMSSSYPLSASITREYFAQGLPQNLTATPNKNHSVVTMEIDVDPLDGKAITEDRDDVPKLEKRHILALESTLNYYTNMSPHYAFSSLEDSITSPPSYVWDKAEQELSLLSIPSIFYGSSIKKGTVSLRFYVSGTLLAELKDKNRNGELIEMTASNPARDTGSVAGVVLYNEGFIILTGSWDLTSSTANQTHKEEYVISGKQIPKWVHFGTGANDKSGSLAHNTSSFQLAFSGTNYVPTVTMLAHAKKGELNHSNNPTYIKYGQQTGSLTAGGEFGFYKEPKNLSIANTVSSSYGCNFTASFKKQTFISQIGIYDKNKNLIGIAKVANPVRKFETDEYTFKLKLDF